MHILTALSLKNRALIALVTIVAAVFGLLGLGSLKQELMPSVQFPTIAVVTSYPGASPEVVNQDVSGPVETALRGVPQLERTSATSTTGSSTVLAEFTYGVDLAATEQKVERAVSRISQALPESADTQVLSGSIDDFPVIQIAVSPAEGETPEEAAQLIERVAIPELSDLEGVREAQLTGARGDRVTIVPNLEALAAQGLGPQAITDTLQQSGVLIAAGTVTEGDRTLAVQAGSEVASAEEVAALPIARDPAALAAPPQELPGGALPGAEPAPAAPPTIGDVAEVRLEANPEQSISRINGSPALTIAVTKMSAANTVDVSHAVQAALDDLADQLGGAEFEVVFDQAPYVEQSIETLTTEGLLGLVFAVLVILVFLMSVRATLVTAISIPTSVLLTFVGLNFADYTLNLLTLGALTISIGRVVDDSIVVIENIKRHLVPGSDRAATIVRAVREVAGAITASTITTVAVFLPMAFVEGMVGELFRPFAFTVTIALVASLLVSLTIVPVLASWFLRPERGGSRRFGPRRTAAAAAERDRTPADDGPPAPDATTATALQRGYRPVIEWTLRRPAITLLIAVVVFGATIAATPLMKTNFMGSDEQNSVGLTQSLEPGTSLEAQLGQAERVEEVLAEVPAVDTVQVTIGSAGGVGALFGGGGDGAVNYAITTDPDADQAEVQDRIREAVDALDDAGEFSLGQSGGGVTTSNAIAVDLTAPDQDTLAEASDAVVAALREQDGLTQVESDLATSRPYLRIAVDRGAAAAAGLTEAGVAGQVAQQMQPQQIGQITVDADTISVYVAAAAPPADQAGVAALPVQTATGPQRLDALATVEVADGPVSVSTEDGVRSVTVSALPEGDDLGTAGASVSAALEAADLPAGANASIGGVMSQQTEAFQQLGIALLAAILIVYVVMVATFRSLLQPLLLLVSVPFAATGAILLLIVTGIPLGVASLIGVLMLIGIVVTNAIVLIDLVNQYRERGDGLREAVLHGSLQRLRPIVMTALATILALTPMALGITGKGGFISQPLAVVVIGGLLSSTALTLIVLPTLYYAVERRRTGGAGPRRRRSPRRPGGGGAPAGSERAPVPGGFGEPASAPAGAGVGAVGAGSALLAGARAGAAPEGSDSGAGPVTTGLDPAWWGREDPGASVPPPVSAASAAALPVADPGAGPEPDAVPERAAPVPEHGDAPEAADAGPRDAADAATRSAILDELFRVGPSAPETANRAAPAVPETDAPEPAFEPGVATEGDGPAAEPDPDPADLGAPHAREPEPEAPDAADRAPGPATEQMSLALADLGFTGDQDPLRSEAGDPEPEANGAGAGDREADDPAAGARAAGAGDPGADGPAVDAAAPAPVEEAAAPAPVDAAADEEPGGVPAPITGELDWEQLLWQATQEVDGEDPDADGPRGAE